MESCTVSFADHGTTASFTHGSSRQTAAATEAGSGLVLISGEAKEGSGGRRMDTGGVGRGLLVKPLESRPQGSPGPSRATTDKFWRDGRAMA